MITLLYCLLFLFLLPLGSAGQSFPFWGAKAPLPLETPVDSLKKGQFTWEAEIAPAGPILVVVSLDEQKAFTYRNGILIGVATVSTGKKGHPTPTGVFTTLQKDVNHHSSIYDNASMPYTQRLTNYGIALHAGGLPGYPSSHGCVHLPSEYARRLFQAAPLGMTVVIANSRTAPQAVDHPAFLSPVSVKGKVVDAKRLDPGESYRWNPELSATGPLSVVISRADQRIVVMRNGIEIGRSRVDFEQPGDSIGTHILVAQNPDTAQLPSVLKDGGAIRKWVSLSFKDLKYEQPVLDPVKDNRFTIPREFLSDLLPQVTTGTSVVITDAAILPQNSGVSMALLTSHPQASGKGTN
ncbi:L,D-transpeptidase [Flavihumibacter petaseus]|uniref:Peptidase C82 family protein n=1 Tax=Flavihumibacter petaseus NBRC 106054 TaxID=1220578 RepID=A0A0E9MZL8_9BACT|nr:L,D-transpeptidase [Flavihumibacter petaseus]GAO43197.1 peptidase C82 family protein [Flavihumibacter petaseus NBRC 106054]